MQPLRPSFVIRTVVLLLAVAATAVPAAAADDNPNQIRRKIAFMLDVVEPPAGAPSAAVAELVAAISDLRPHIGFSVVAATAGGVQTHGRCDATRGNPEGRIGATEFLGKLAPPKQPGDPLQLVRTAVPQNAELYYLLVDHDWPDPDAVARAIVDLKKQTPGLRVNVVLVHQPGRAAPGKAMLAAAKVIAEGTGGRFRVAEPPAGPATKPATAPAAR